MATVPYRKQSVQNINWLQKSRILQKATKTQLPPSSMDNETIRVQLLVNT